MVNDLRAKDLEIQGCKIFICPNLGMIDIKGKETNLSEKAINRAKDLANEYVKRTYQRPHYSSIKNLIPAFIYIASIIEDGWDDRKTQFEISQAFGTTECTVRKWYKDVIEILSIE